MLARMRRGYTVEEYLEKIELIRILVPGAAITPFNFPLNLVAHKVAPAIAAGNAPSSACPRRPLSSGPANNRPEGSNSST